MDAPRAGVGSHINGRTARRGGFTLIEVLVAVLVLSLGLLGLAALQLRALTNNQSSLQRSTAVFLTYSIIDSMRADRVNALSGAYALALDDDTPSGTTFAKKQLNDWRTQLETFLGADASGGITCQNSPCSRVRVQVRWFDARGTESGTTEEEIESARTQTLTTEIRL